MITRIFLLAVMALATTGAFAQAEKAEEEVKAVVNSLFAAMKAADSVALRSVFAPGVILQTIVKDSAGESTVRTESADRFIQSIGRAQSGWLDEQISFEQVLVDDAMALAWTPYKFYYKGSFSHCGVNCFQLIKRHGEWKINFLIDTRRKTSCE